MNTNCPHGEPWARPCHGCEIITLEGVKYRNEEEILSLRRQLSDIRVFAESLISKGSADWNHVTGEKILTILNP